MKKLRIIPKLDVKGPNVVKGICLEGLRVLGKPADFARKYYEQGADEILYIDIVASLYERNNLLDVVKESASKGVFIPMTVGGGVRTLDDIKEILRAGADKVAINTAATKNPEFITEASKMFGSQCIVGAVEAKKLGDGKWEAYIDNGREKTGLDAVKWAKKLVELGAGELLITSVDRDGTKKGFEKELVKKIALQVSVPVIACGGAGSIEDIEKCFEETACDAVSFASILHYDITTIKDVKKHLLRKRIPMRKVTDPLPVLDKPSDKKKVISIIDYGLGNLKSVTAAFMTMGNKVRFVSSPEEIHGSELLVLPGVGAFEDGMKGLAERELIEAIRKYVNSGNPLLGICLGMQLLMTESEEFGLHKGLGLISGRVVSFKPPEEIDTRKHSRYRVPHVGWNEIKNSNEWKGTLLSGNAEGEEVYFVHSFCVIPDDKEDWLANASYGGQEFCAVLKKGNVYGTQFHPEKSGRVGMEMIKWFSNL